MFLSELIFLPVWVYIFVYWCVYPCACTMSLLSRMPPTRNQLRPRQHLWRPLISPQVTSARVQSRFEFVEIGGDTSSNWQGEVPAKAGITSWYQLVPRTIYVRVHIVCSGTWFTCSIWMRTYPLWPWYYVSGRICYYLLLFMLLLMLSLNYNLLGESIKRWQLLYRHKNTKHINIPW